jgi:heme-degrading monooxygenase HmoA
MPPLSGPRVRHTVVFTLRHEERSEEAQGFLAALSALRSIDGVEAFELLRQISGKNPYTFGVTMEFASRAAYDAYDADPDHVAFVRDRWAVDVDDFMEIDFTALPAGRERHEGP